MKRGCTGCNAGFVQRGRIDAEHCCLALQGHEERMGWLESQMEVGSTPLMHELQCSGLWVVD